MNLSAEHLTAAVLALPSEARAALVDRLIESLDPVNDHAQQALWASEALRRRDEVRDGRVATVPAADAFAKVREAVTLPR